MKTSMKEVRPGGDIFPLSFVKAVYSKYQTDRIP